MKTTLYILGIRYGDANGDTVSYSLCTSEMPQYGYFTAGQIEVEWEAPTEDTTQIEIENLKAMKAAFIKESTARLEKIDDQIAKLKCLTYEPA